MADEKAYATATFHDMLFGTYRLTIHLDEDGDLVIERTLQSAPHETYSSTNYIRFEEMPVLKRALKDLKD